MQLTKEQRAWILRAMERARVENCWCIVHDPITDEHNRMPSTPAEETA